MQDTKTILCFSGFDPGGSAGIQADIESIAAQGCHAASIITCQTIQDSQTFAGIEPVDTKLVQKQVQLLASDITIDAIKIGMLGSASMAETVAALIAELPDIPVVLDPVLRSGSGSSTADSALKNALTGLLLPLASLVTPNQYEAKQLTGLNDLTESANKMLRLGSKHVLVTSTDGTHGEQIEHYYHGVDAKPRILRTPRLKGSFHGSGCTLAAAIAAGLANGHNMLDAIDSALAYTAETLHAARQIGVGQMTPRRIL